MQEKSFQEELEENSEMENGGPMNEISVKFRWQHKIIKIYGNKVTAIGVLGERSYYKAFTIYKPNFGIFRRAHYQRCL